MIVLALLLAQAASDPAIERGNKIFHQTCAVGYCHGVGGAASRGPRLRGRTFARDYLVKVTRDGIPNSAMPPWKDKLSEDDIKVVVAYVMTLANAGPSGGAPPTPGGASQAVPEFVGPPEVKRGRDLFFDAARGVRCGSCHMLGGSGVAVGPNLARAVRTGQVKTAKLRSGETFPAILVEQNDKFVKLYDLTAAPPVLRTLLASELAGLADNSSWKHDSVTGNYTAAERVDVDKFVQWMAEK